MNDGFRSFTDQDQDEAKCKREAGVFHGESVDTRADNRRDGLLADVIRDTSTDSPSELLDSTLKLTSRLRLIANILPRLSGTKIVRL